MSRRVCKLVIGVGLLASAVQAEQVTVFAASSLRDAVREISQSYENETGTTVTLVFTASSTIARLVAQGAPADVVLLADRAWADWVIDQGILDRLEAFAGNRLVLITTSDALLSDAADLPSLLGAGHLAMAQVDAVPAGRYGKAALVSLDLWDAVEPRVVQAANVRAALRFVERGEAAFGIGYASDLIALPALSEAYGFAEESHPPIQYYGGTVTPQGGAFLAFIQSETGQGVLGDWGFSPPESGQ